MIKQYYASAASIAPAQKSLRLDLLSLLTPNSRALVAGLFRTASQRRNVTRVPVVISEVHRELSRRTLQAWGEAESAAYSDALALLCDNDAASRQYAAACLKSAGKEVRA